MKKFFEYFSIFLGVFVAIYTLNSFFTWVLNDHDFFYLTPQKLTIRVLISALITANIYVRRERVKK